MMLWPNRAAAWLRRLGFWRVMAIVVALVLLWITLQGVYREFRVWGRRVELKGPLHATPQTAYDPG